MARLPDPGRDADQWGGLLNEFLRVAHREDGNLRSTSTVVNVRDFGATGDEAGNGTDTAAIQAALDAVPAAGVTVYLPAGTYIVNDTLTIRTNRTTLQGEYGATMIKAQDGSSFEYVLKGGEGYGAQWVKKSALAVRDLMIDANQQNRPQGSRTVAVGLNCDDAECSGLIVKNTIGAPDPSDPAKVHSGVGLGINGSRNRVSHCSAIDCGGTDRNQSDGFYLSSGTQNLLIGCVAKNCTDTGFVIETASSSGMLGCTASNCGAGAAITNASATAANGNFMIGVTIDGWSAPVTGGIQIGVPTQDAGDLVDTVINGVILRNAGSGPAVRIASLGAGTVKGLVISNITIDGSGTQGLLLMPNVEDVSVIGGSIRAGETTVQLSENCRNILIQGLRLYVGGREFTRGVSVGHLCNHVMIQNCLIQAADPSTPYAWGIYTEGAGVDAAQNVRTDGNVIRDYYNGAIGAADPASLLTPSQPNSTATDLAILTEEFNALLANLREVGVLRL